MRHKIDTFVWFALWAACCGLAAHFLTRGPWTPGDWLAAGVTLGVAGLAGRETHRIMVGRPSE